MQPAIRRPVRSVIAAFTLVLSTAIAGWLPSADWSGPVVSASRVGGLTAVGTDQPPPATAAPLGLDQMAARLSAEVYGYLPYWELDSTVDAYLRYDLMTDIALFSIGFNADGTIDTGATGYARMTGTTAATIVAHAHAAGVRVDMTVTSFGFAKNAAFFANAAAQDTAIQAISSFVATGGLDGVNLDVELLYNADFAAFGAFAGRLRDALRATNPVARVSVATNGSISGAGMAAVALANGADRAFIMGYNYRTAGSNPSGAVGPLARTDGGKSLTTTLDLYASQGVPADRLLLGLPYFGRTWPTVSSALNAATLGSGPAWFPKTGLATIPPGAIVDYDPIEQVRRITSQDPVTGVWSQTYYDDSQSLRAKYALAADRGLAGVGIWALGYDRGQAGYWEAIAGSFGAIRIAGADRFATAAAVSANWTASPVDTVYIATGLDYPDALAGSAVAGREGAPLLLVRPLSVPASTAAELARLQPRRIVVLGGPSVVSDAVAAELATSATEGVVRLAGVDRYGTAAAVSQAAYPNGAPVAYLVSGRTFADAVSAAPAAARDGGPVLLTDPFSLSAATAAELQRLAPARVVIVGGESAVVPSVAAQIGGLLPGATVQRIAGLDRYATSAAVAATFATGPSAVYLATGTNFPDALAGAAAAGARGSPMVLTAGQALPATVSAALVGLRPRHAVIVGGATVVADAVLVATRAILGGP